MALAGLICGSRTPTGWTASKDKVDFYDLKGDLEALLDYTGLGGEFRIRGTAACCPAPWAVGGADSWHRDVGLARVSCTQESRPSWVSPRRFIYFQVNVAKIVASKLPKFEEVSKFPEVRRDLAFFVDNSVQSGALL